MSNDPNMAEFIEDTYSDCEKKARAEVKDFAEMKGEEISDAELKSRWEEWANSRKNAKVYIPLRTLNLLHMSQHPLRVVQGPVGCLSSDTEVMTPAGWIPICEWDGQEILQWDHETRETAFAKPKKYIHAPAGRLISFRNANALSMVLSPNHRVPVYNYDGKFAVKTAEELEKHPSRNVIPTTWEPSSEGINMDDNMLRLWVAIAADGCYPKRGKRCVFGLRKERKKKRLTELLDRLGIPWKRMEHSTRPTESNFYFDRPNLPKHLDWRLSQASRRQAEIVMEEMRLWDGLSASSYERFDSTNKQDADIIQYLAACAGRTSLVHREEAQGKHWNAVYHVSPARMDSPKNVVSLRCDNTRITEGLSPDGNQYCFETDTGFFVARHNGFIFVTGNSGKSYGCHYDIALRCAGQSPCSDGNIRNRALFSRGTYQQLKQTTMDLWMRLFPTTKIALSSPIQGELTMKLGNRLSIIKIFGVPMDMVSAEATLRSNGYSIARVEEIQYISYNSITIIRERLGRYPDINDAPIGFQKNGYFKDFGLTADTNAPVEGSWLHERATKVKDPDELYLFQPPAMFRNWNPETKEWDYEENKGQRFETHGIAAAENVEHLNKGWRYYWEMVGYKDDEDIRRNVMNEYGHVLSGTPVYPEFSKSRHVSDRRVEMPPRGTMLFCGMDGGRTPRAVFGYYAKNGGVRIPLVLGRDNCGLEMFATSVMRPSLAARGVHPSQVTIFPDPSIENKGEQGESTGVEVLRACGFNVTLPVLKNNDPFTRVETVKQALTRTATDGDPYIQIDPSGEELIRAWAGGYTYATTKGANGMTRTGDKPGKGPYSHVANASEYLLVGLKYGAREDRAFGGGARARGFAERFTEASDGKDKGLFC